MKSTPVLIIAGVCLLLRLSAFAADTSSKAASPSTTSPAPAASTGQPGEKSSPGLAESKELEEAMRAHIRPTRVQLPMATPPPPPRSETKPASPTGDWVWVPGHWAPVKGKWQWKAGEWGAPATPISVWIEPKYDEKSKVWTAGYWQPDREEPYDQEPAKEAPPPTEKFF